MPLRFFTGSSLVRLVILLALPFALERNVVQAQPPVAVFAHGFQATGDFPAWLQVLSAAAIARAGGGTVLEYDPDSGEWVYLEGSMDPDQPISLSINWAQDSAFVPGVTDDRRGTAAAAASAVYASLRGAPLPGALGISSPLFDAIGQARPIHLIGHSRGASVQTELALRLLDAGFSVDHFTTLDPHPVVELLDVDPVVWEGVEWADNYYRADGCDIDSGCFGFDFDGQVVPGAANIDLGFLDSLDPFDNRFATCTLEHIKVRVWYFGTMDLTATTEGTCDVERGAWYSSSGDNEGFFFSRFAGGEGQRPCGPSGGCPDQGRVVLEPVASIENGDFQYGANQLAGWLWHGGGGSGEVVTDGGETFLRLRESTPRRRSNRNFLPLDTTELAFDLAVTLIDPEMDDELVFELIAPGQPPLEIARIGLNVGSSDWIRDQRVALPPSIPTDRLYSLELRLESEESIASTIGVDNLAWIAGPLSVEFRRGDCNQDGLFDISDPVYLLSAQFAGGSLPECDDACDAGDDGRLDISDAVYLLNALVGGGAAPAPPVDCGPDPTPDTLECDSAISCP